MAPVEPRLVEHDVYQALSNAILAGDFLPGAQLVEAQIAAKLRVSKTPVREALIRLERDGLVEALPFRGARVSTPSVEDARQVCELRKWIELQVARSAAESASPSLLLELNENLGLTKESIASGDRQRTLSILVEFSRILRRTNGNAYASEILTRLEHVGILISHMSRLVGQTRRDEQSVKEHEDIVTAIANRDPDAAARAVERHIDSVERAYEFALQVEDKATGRESVPVDAKAKHLRI